MNLHSSSKERLKSISIGSLGLMLEISTCVGEFDWELLVVSCLLVRLDKAIIGDPSKPNT